MAMISILGLYDYDNTIFDDLELPEGIDKDDLVDTILFQNAELELLYTEPTLMKRAIGRWGRISQYTWEKWVNTLNLEYNPIWNRIYNYREEETINRDTNGSASGSDTGKVSAYNETTFTNRNLNESEAESSQTEDVDRVLTRDEGGNIGVTTTQKMITDEREVALFNIYNKISEDFRKRFCIMVY